MFERFTETARRVIFIARFEASASGNEIIEPWHLLLGILREDKALAARILGNTALDDFKREFSHRMGRVQANTSVDMALSEASRAALDYAFEEAGRAHSHYVVPAHLLAGLMRADGLVQQVLNARGITLEQCRMGFATMAEMTPYERLQQALIGVPGDRVAAALRILEALAAPEVSVEVALPDRSFSVRFPEGNGDFPGASTTN